MKKLILSEIWIYPIKSLGGIRLNHAKVYEKGLEFDRRWMLVDEDGTFMTQRDYPKMALFKMALKGQSLLVALKNPFISNNPSITIEASATSKGDTVNATIWNDKVETVEVDPKISAWFSEHLGLKCRLVNFPEKNPRAVDPLFKVNDEHVSLADAYPFLIIGQSSLDDLNTKLEHDVPMNRFRPNFVFTGGNPFEEDEWRNLIIGNNRFVGVKPCARCMLPTIDQDTAEKSQEPLATLSRYRKRNNKVLFGQNLVALDHFSVNEGDIIIIPDEA